MSVEMRRCPPLALTLALLAAAALCGSVLSCGQTAAAKCSQANCPGCCRDNVCQPFPAQAFTTCGLGGAACRACLPGQLCATGRCLADPDASFIPDDAGN